MVGGVFISIVILIHVGGSFEDGEIGISRSEFEILLDNMKNMEIFAHEQAGLIQQQQQTIDTLENKVRDLSSKCGTQADKQELKSRVRRHSDDVVAFSATLKQVNVQHVGVHQNIIFSDVITNFGNGYNNHHGVFVAPVSGLYMLTTTILSGQNVEFAVAIEINGTDVVRMFERGTDNRHGSATQTIIVQLRKGDDVSVQSLSVDHTYWGDRYSSFSGVLLHEFETEKVVVG